MDEHTFSAFNDLWKLWKDNQKIANDAKAWEHVSAAVEKIWNDAPEARDPQFIREFCLSVISSLHRINMDKN